MIPIIAVLALGFLPVLAEPITSNRVSALPAGQQSAWGAYLERSGVSALADQAAVQAEVAALKLTNALKAPSGGDFKLNHPAGDAWYAGEEAGQLADAILSYQTLSGGWSKHLGFSRGPRQPGMQWTAQNEPGQPAHYVATFDNGSTTSEMDFLARVWQSTHREDCRAGFLKGLDFILAAQFPSGGWPQVYPLEGGYHDDITFNDDAMTHVLEVLSAIVRRAPAYAFVEEPRRRQAAEALANGVHCILETQVVQHGRKTAWCAQHDPLTLQPAPARKMEPATLSGLESAHILEFLMTLTHPTPELVAGIESGLKWLEEVQITQVGTTHLNGKTIYVSDPASDRIRWARFYDLTNSRPVFPGRDGVLYESFAAMAEKNKLGYDFYTTQPGSILKNGQKKWRKMRAVEADKSERPSG